MELKNPLRAPLEISFIEKNLPHTFFNSKKMKKFEIAVDKIKSKLTYDGVYSLLINFENLLDSFYTPEQRSFLLSINKQQVFISDDNFNNSSNKIYSMKSKLNSEINLNLKDDNKYDSNIMIKINNNNMDQLNLADQYRNQI